MAGIRRRGRRPGVAEAQPDPADGLDPFRAAQLAAEGRHVHVDGLGRAVPVRVPDLLQDGLAADDGPRILGEKSQEIELLGRQGHLGPVDEDPSGTAIDGEGPEDLDLVQPGRLSAAPHDGADPGDQLPEAERLDDVVVRAQLQPDHPIDLGAASGDHQDRDGRPGPQLLAEVVAVHVGQAQVEKHHLRGGGGQGAGPGATRLTSNPSLVSPSASGSAIPSSSSTTRILILKGWHAIRCRRHLPVWVSPARRPGVHTADTVSSSPVFSNLVG